MRSFTAEEEEAIIKRRFLTQTVISAPGDPPFKKLVKRYVAKSFLVENEVTLKLAKN